MTRSDSILLDVNQSGISVQCSISITCRQRHTSCRRAARVAEGDRLVKPAVVLMPNDWSPSTLARYRRAGNGPAFTKVGRNIGYSLASLRAWQRGEALSATEA